MNTKTQEQVWDNIAEEWHAFKQRPSPHTSDFLKKCKGKVLDLGSGSGRYLTKIKNGKMFLVDFSKEMIKLAKKKAKKEKIGAEFSVAGLEKLPYEDNFFDAAIASSSLHCIPKKQHKKVVKELYRVLKKGAEAEISVWNRKSKRFKNAGKEKMIKWRDKGERYYYLFEEKELENLLTAVGFKIKKKLDSEMMIIFVVSK